jgi:hypothetical protein
MITKKKAMKNSKPVSIKAVLITMLIIAGIIVLRETFLAGFG